MAKQKKRTAKGNGAATPSDPAYPELFQPIKIGSCRIENRIVMAPMNVLMSSGNTGFGTKARFTTRT